MFKLHFNFMMRNNSFIKYYYSPLQGLTLEGGKAPLVLIFINFVLIEYIKKK